MGFGLGFGLGLGVGVGVGVGVGLGVGRVMHTISFVGRTGINHLTLTTKNGLVG